MTSKNWKCRNCRGSFSFGSLLEKSDACACCAKHSHLELEVSRLRQEKMLVLPIIDLSQSKGDGRKGLVKRLYDALTTSGFFYLKGVQGWDSEELLSLCKWFFRLPDEAKSSVSRKMFNSNATHAYRGFFPAQPSEVSHKEGFEIGPADDRLPENAPTLEERVLTETNQWPNTGNEDKDHLFKQRMEYYHSLFNEAGKEIMKMLAEAWGLESDFFIPMFSPEHLSTFRLLHYPPRGESPIQEAIDGEYILQCEEHKDSGILTLLPNLNYEGLQIRGTDGKWVNVPNVDGCLVVNIGELLEIISGGVLKATKHRVIDTGEDRFSCPFFLEPSFHANINIRLPPPPKTMSNGTRRPNSEHQNENLSTIDSREPIGYGVWLIQKMTIYAETRALIDSARTS